MDVDHTTTTIKNNTIAHDSGFGNDAAAVSNWVNGTQKVGYVETVSTVLTSGHTSILDNSSLGGSTSMNYCTTGSHYYWGWPHSSCNIAHYLLPVPAVHEHDFVQAASPYEATLFCRKCGDTKKLKMSKKEIRE